MGGRCDQAVTQHLIPPRCSVLRSTQHSPTPRILTAHRADRRLPNSAHRVFRRHSHRMLVRRRSPPRSVVTDLSGLPYLRTFGGCFPVKCLVFGVHVIWGRT